MIVTILVTITEILDVPLYANISENVRPGTIVKFINVSNVNIIICSIIFLSKTMGVISSLVLN